MDLDKPEEATVTGQAQFYVPAYAGLTLDVGGGLKARLGNAYAKGRVGLYGSLGLLVEGSFDVDIAWNSGGRPGGRGRWRRRLLRRSSKWASASVAVGVDR